jgi:type VI secretion system secreted protein Hcp
LNIPSIPGESTDPNHLGWIDVLSWSLGATGSNSATACGATGASSGQGSQTQELTVVKNIDSASPALMQSNFVGRGLGTVTLDVTESLPKQTNADYLQYTFTDTIVSSVQWVGSGGDSPMERITMQYAGVSISYQPQNADGTLGSPITACYNVVTQTSC